MTDHTNTASRIGLSGNQLKIIAMLCMLCDHVALQFCPDVLVLRILGRLSFPIFAYMIAEGCRYTRSRARYFTQLFLLGAVCQAVFTVVAGTLYMGILITFSLSVLTIYCVDGLLHTKRFRCYLLFCLSLSAIAFVVFVAPVLFAPYGFALDYSFCGVLLPVAIYYTPGKWYKLLAAASVLVVHAFVFGNIRWFSLLALPLLALYNGARGKAKLKYLFYIFYPSHLVIIYLIDMLLQLLG